MARGLWKVDKIKTGQVSQMSWTYKGKPVLSNDDMPEGTECFVYLITNKLDGRKYIGKKIAWSVKTSVKTVLTKTGEKKKKKTKTKVPSDWMKYWSSSPNLHLDIDKLGEKNFSREILYYCQNKGSANYYEAREQMDQRVLESDLFYNRILDCKIHASHVKPVL